NRHHDPGREATGGPGRHAADEEGGALMVEITLRGMKSPKAGPNTIHQTGEDPLAALDAVLDKKDFPDPEPVIEWKGTDATHQLAALDLDAHGTRKPDPFRLRCDVRATPFQPDRWWTTHGGGLRAIFVAREEMDADQIAAAWAAMFLQKPLLWPTGVEIKA